MVSETGIGLQKVPGSGGSGCVGSPSSMQSGVPLAFASVSARPQPHTPGTSLAASIGHMSLQSGITSPSRLDIPGVHAAGPLPAVGMPTIGPLPACGGGVVIMPAPAAPAVPVTPGAMPGPAGGAAGVPPAPIPGLIVPI